MKTIASFCTAALVALCFSTGLLADDETARAEERADLLAALKTAPNDKVALAAITAIWELWQTAPDEQAQELLDNARQRMRVYDFNGAMVHLDELVAYAPDYAEGWNTRATTLFLQEKYDRSLDDVEKTLALEPAHFGALSGKAVILMRQGRAALSQKALRRAVEVNPYLRERGMLIDVPE
jgi:tetratricopeptide (TPR) repeat protein